MLKLITLENKIDDLDRKLSLFTGFDLTRFDSLFDFFSTSFPLFLKDLNGVYLNCNDFFSETIFGCNKKIVIGKSLDSLHSKAAKKCIEMYCLKEAQILEVPKKQSYELSVKCWDGIERSYLFFKLSFTIKNKVSGTLGIMLDISTYNQTIKELDKVNNTLDDFFKHC